MSEWKVAGRRAAAAEAAAEAEDTRRSCKGTPAATYFFILFILEHDSAVVC